MNGRNIVGALALVACSCLTLSADNAKSRIPPRGVVVALAADERTYCYQYRYDSCHQTFRANLQWRKLLITPTGRDAILVESENLGFCGSSGCSLYLFLQQPNGEFVQVLGKQGDTGDLESITVLKTITKDHFNIQKTWSDGKTHSTYRWNGLRYSLQSVSEERTRPAPEFSDFHVEQVYSGRNATPKVTDEWQSFKTRIRVAAFQPPNFAGAYRIVEWGCGSDCVRFVLLDLKSGSVHAPPFESLWLDAFATYGWYGKGLEYRSDSKLLIADGCPDEKCATYYYVWTEGAFNLIRVITRHPRTPE